MKAYYDNEGLGNCSHLPSLAYAGRYHDQNIISAGFEISHEKDYRQGIYIVEVQHNANSWTGAEYRRGGPLRHVLYEIPLDVIAAARSGNMLIVIDSQAEGFPLIYLGCDGFAETHAAMRNLQLPKRSVIIVDSNQKFKNLYHAWCIDNQCPVMIEHVPFFTHTFYFKNKLTESLVNNAILNTNSKDFSSLNRTMRGHRSDHLVQIILDGILDKGLVSGYYSNRPESSPHQQYTNLPNELYHKLLKTTLPLTIDGRYEMHDQTPDRNSETIFNHNIYKNSLLSFVTETAFHFPGAFLTEKTMKPIAAGHPFIILGQYRILDTLRKMGYKTDFDGIDQTYDNIEDPYERFAAAHRSLKKWVEIGRSAQIKCIQNSLPSIDYNRSLFNQQDYDAHSYSLLFKKCKEILNQNKV